MKNEILRILESHFKNSSNINIALNDLCNLLKIDKEQSYACPNCNSPEMLQFKTGEWENGIEYKCDKCGHIHDITYFE